MWLKDLCFPTTSTLGEVTMLGTSGFNRRELELEPVCLKTFPPPTSPVTYDLTQQDTRAASRTCRGHVTPVTFLLSRTSPLIRKLVFNPFISSMFHCPCTVQWEVRLFFSVCGK